jgi:hypothetical protein
MVATRIFSRPLLEPLSPGAPPQGNRGCWRPATFAGRPTVHATYLRRAAGPTESLSHGQGESCVRSHFRASKWPPLPQRRRAGAGAGLAPPGTPARERGRLSRLQLPHYRSKNMLAPANGPTEARPDAPALPPTNMCWHCRGRAAPAHAATAARAGGRCTQHGGRPPNLTCTHAPRGTEAAEDRRAWQPKRTGCRPAGRSVFMLIHQPVHHVRACCPHCGDQRIVRGGAACCQ